jgi:hypothetical protein
MKKQKGTKMNEQNNIENTDCQLLINRLNRYIKFNEDEKNVSGVNNYLNGKIAAYQNVIDEIKKGEFIP